MGCGGSKQTKRHGRGAARTLHRANGLHSAAAVSPRCHGYDAPRLHKIESGQSWERTPSFEKRFKLDPVVAERVRQCRAAQVATPFEPEELPTNGQYKTIKTG